MKNLFVVLITAYLGLLHASTCFAGQIGLSTGEVLNTRSIELPEHVEVTLEDGSIRKINIKDIQSIELQSMKSVTRLLDQGTKLSNTEISSALNEFKELGPFETPKQTFLTWKEHASKGSIDGMASCYTKYRQDDVRKNLKKIKKRDRKQMQHTMQVIDFVTADPMYQGKQAFLEVTWSKGLHSESQVLKFELETDQWKIIQ